MNLPLIQRNFDLSVNNTFGFTQFASHYVEVSSDEQLSQAVAFATDENLTILPLGSGSNIVFTKDFSGLVIKQLDQVIQYQRNDLEDSLSAIVPAGANWDSLVKNTVNRGLNGLENLSLIPGTAGAAPVQNIGAYGVELSDRLISLRALHIPTGKWMTFSNADCDFSYRNSLFKREIGQYIIRDITLQLSRNTTLNTSYAVLTDYLNRYHPDELLNSKLVSKAVCAIRQSKLPDPEVLPNAGSFFHNPVVSAKKYISLKTSFPELVGHRQNNGEYKLAAGWLIDHLGYKGYRKNGVGVHTHQALVLIKYGQSSGKELLDLANKIQNDVQASFDVQLSIEPTVL